jgi:lipopolysaccharide biosynthesis glycosyltransferase
MGRFIRNKLRRLENQGVDVRSLYNPNSKSNDNSSDNVIQPWVKKNYKLGDKVIVKNNLGEFTYECCSSHNALNYNYYGNGGFIEGFNNGGVYHKLWTRITFNNLNDNTIFIKNKKLPKKYALTTILNNSFSKYFYVFLNSFLENNTWFFGDVIVLYDDILSPLSEENISKIKLLYKNIIFKKIESDKYINVINLFKSKVDKSFHRFIPSIFTIEIFNLVEYEKVLYLDSDMLIINNIEELFLLKNNVVVTRDTSIYNRDNKIKPIGCDKLILNGGFVLLDGDFIKSENHVENMLNLFPKLNKPTYLDQSLMNEYFKNYSILFISSDYNLLKRCFDDTKIKEFNYYLNNIKIVHYVGEKPWDEKEKEFEKKYKNIENLWSGYHLRYKHVSEKIKSLSLLASGVYDNEIIDLLPNIKDTKIATTNWGFKYNDIININYYYCSTPDKTLIDEINKDNFKPSDLWLLTDNVKEIIEKYKIKSTNNINPFNFIINKSDEYSSIINKRVINKSLPLPTSGVSMLLFFSLLDVDNINLVGYNLYTKKNKDGSYKQHGISKYVNPYNNKIKPHNFEFDLNFIIIALHNLINKGVVINFYNSDIIENMYHLIKEGLTYNMIINKIKETYE